MRLVLMRLRLNTNDASHLLTNLHVVHVLLNMHLIKSGMKANKTRNNEVKEELEKLWPGMGLAALEADGSGTPSRSYKQCT